VASSKGKIGYFEWARALGALAIVALHVQVACALSQSLSDAHATSLFVEAEILVPLTRWAVPVFFMISGALLLDPERQMGWRKVGRHVWRLALVLLTFGFAFCLMEQAFDDHALGLAQLGAAVVALLSGDTWDHLWFLYALIDLYLLTPLVRPFVAGASRRELGWVIVGLWAMHCVVHTVNVLSGEYFVYLSSLPYALVYYLAGYWLHRYGRLSRGVVAAGLVSVVACMVLYALLDDAGAGVVLPEHAFMLPYAVMVFLALKRWLDRPVETHPVVALLADYSFGIYVIHPLFGHVIILLGHPMEWPFPLVQVAIFVAGVLGSIAITWLVRRIPLFRGKI
jgi:surface polysaccharide O-acyltransferase-like enzyme